MGPSAEALAISSRDEKGTKRDEKGEKGTTPIFEACLVARSYSFHCR